MFKIAVFRALQLGDILCSMPAVAALKYNYPQAQLYFIGLPHMRPLIERFGFIDFFVDFPGHPALPEIACDEQELEKFVCQMQIEKFDLLLQMHGNGTVVNDFLTGLRAKRLVGFQPSDHSSQDWLAYPTHLHEVDRHLELIRFLGLEIQNCSLFYPLFESDWNAYHSIRSRISPPFVIVHVGSRDARRRWPIANFAYLAKLLLEKKYQVVLTGVAIEQPLVDELLDHLDGRAVSLCGQLGLGTLGCLVKEASLLLCNCTGISHIAAGLATKSIVLSMDGEPQRWGPKNKALHKTYDARGAINLEMLSREINLLLEYRPPADSAVQAGSQASS